MNLTRTTSSRYVLFLQGSTGLGGSKRSLLDTIRALRETDYQPVVACPQKGWLTEELDKLGIHYVLVPFYAWRKWLERPRVVSTIRKHWLPALAPWRFDIVHSNEIWWAPHAIEVGKSLKVPAAVHFRDGRHTLKKAHQYALGKVDSVLLVSSELRAQFVPDSQLFNKARVLFNGHEEIVFHGDREKARHIFNLGSDDMVIGSAGKLSEVKNQRLLLRTMAELKRQERLTRFKILFAGDAEPGYAQLMDQDVQQLGLQQNVKFLGLVHNMGAFFSATDFIVHCSRYEGLPRVVPEAMLARRAVVAVGTGGMHDAIPNKQFGSVVPMNDQGTLENEIECLSKNPGLREKLAEQAYQRARSLFSLAAHRDKIATLYEDLVAGKQREANLQGPVLPNLPP